MVERPGEVVDDGRVRASLRGEPLLLLRQRDDGVGGDGEGAGVGEMVLHGGVPRTALAGVELGLDGRDVLRELTGDGRETEGARDEEGGARAVGGGSGGHGVVTKRREKPKQI